MVIGSVMRAISRAQSDETRRRGGASTDDGGVTTAGAARLCRPLRSGVSWLRLGMPTMAYRNQGA